MLATCAAALFAACSHGIDAAEAKAPPSHGAELGRDSEWGHLVPHIAPAGPARTRDGRLDGPVTLWHENGIKAAEGEYRDEQRQGLWRFWHPNGMLRWEGAFDHGTQVGLQRAWYANGQMQYESVWQGGELDGKFSSWHENGKLALQCAFLHGAQSGEVRRWNEDGEFDRFVSGVYRGGDRVAALPPSALEASAKR